MYPAPPVTRIFIKSPECGDYKLLMSLKAPQVRSNLLICWRLLRAALSATRNDKDILWPDPPLGIPADVFFHMRAPVFLGMGTAVEMPFMDQAKIIELGFHLACPGQFRIVVTDIHEDARARGGRDVRQPACNLGGILLQDCQGM